MTVLAVVVKAAALSLLSELLMNGMLNDSEGRDGIFGRDGAQNHPDLFSDGIS